MSVSDRQGCDPTARANHGTTEVNHLSTAGFDELRPVVLLHLGGPWRQQSFQNELQPPHFGQPRGRECKFGIFLVL